MAREKKRSAYVPRQGYVDPKTHRFVVTSQPKGGVPEATDPLAKAREAKALKAATRALIEQGEVQTTPETIQLVYEVALKRGILEEGQAFDPDSGVIAAWIDPSDNTLHESVAGESTDESTDESDAANPEAATPGSEAGDAATDE